MKSKKEYQKRKQQLLQWEKEAQRMGLYMGLPVAKDAKIILLDFVRKNENTHRLRIEWILTRYLHLNHLSEGEVIQ